MKRGRGDARLRGSTSVRHVRRPPEPESSSFERGLDGMTALQGGPSRSAPASKFGTGKKGRRRVNFTCIRKRVSAVRLARFDGLQFAERTLPNYGNTPGVN
ncbi:uncharacterized protein LOC143824389 isoform X2 [Paroedura picta]